MWRHVLYVQLSFLVQLCLCNQLSRFPKLPDMKGIHKQVLDIQVSLGNSHNGRYPIAVTNRIHSKLKVIKCHLSQILGKDKDKYQGIAFHIPLNQRLDSAKDKHQVIMLNTRMNRSLDKDNDKNQPIRLRTHLNWGPHKDKYQHLALMLHTRGNQRSYKVNNQQALPYYRPHQNLSKFNQEMVISTQGSKVSRRERSGDYTRESYGTPMESVSENEQMENDIDDKNIDDVASQENIDKAVVASHEEEKRGLKARRFLSNVQTSLKEHINKDEAMWRTSKKEIKKTFETYYQCLKKKVEFMKKEEFPITAFLAVEGEKVEMPCNVCYRPDQSEESQKAFWQVLRHDTSSVEEVHTDDRIRMSHDYTLIVENIDVNDAGQYFCVERHDYLAVYQLDVFLTDKRRNVRLGEEALQAETYLMDHNLRVFTMWASWGECNTCDRPGESSRIGQCTVKKIYQDMPVFPRDYPLMTLYPEGVPCHSTALPRHIRRLSEIGLRESETLYKPCDEPCPTDPPMAVITDESGDVVEMVEAGFHSMKEKPPLPSLVKRKVLYEPETSHLVLNCPTEHQPNMIHWARREREVDPVEIKKMTRGRVWVDSLSRLHFKPLLLSDTDVYNCWKKTERIASIKLIVVSQKNQKIKHYISYAGLGATGVGSLICIFCLCCKKSDKNAT